MSFYTPTYIKKYEVGLVQSRQNFIIPDDAYPVLENAFVWRERVKRKAGYELLGRLRRVLTGQSLGVLDGAGSATLNIRTTLIPNLESTGEIEPGSVSIAAGTDTMTDDGLGVLTGVPNGKGTINYTTMDLTITGATAAGAIVAAFNYFPGLPCMGLRTRELNNVNEEDLIAFDTKYAYRYLVGWQEFITGTTWTGNDSDFFWSTNFFVGDLNLKIFWATNFSGTSGDPIRYSNGITWEDFTPQITAPSGTNEQLYQCQAMLPFRGRMVAFNTFEGTSLATSVNKRQRIRWSAIGTPFTRAVLGVVTPVNANAWSDYIPGQGGFLDIPTAEDIVSVGFVRDNLVVFCERSTWQLRYTGRTIAPFQIEKVNTELGAESTFSAVQFDTSLVGVGDKGIVECDSYKSDRIDIKIPDLTFRFNNNANGTKRVHGIRDFQQRIAYWTYPTQSTEQTYPNRRLVYNYENDSWAIFTDSFTCLGTFQPTQAKRWIDFPGPGDNDQWQDQTYPWLNIQTGLPTIVGGNQQGFVEKLGQYGFDYESTNDISLTINDITGNTTTPTSIKSTSHNLVTGQVIRITDIPTGTPFATSLNDQIFMIEFTNVDNFILWVYDPDTGQFSTPQTDVPDTYIGGGSIAIRDNFKIQSKKFNYWDDGNAIQLGFMDILLNETSDGAITLNVYADYNDTEPLNTLPQNNFESVEDTFFNSVIPTFSSTFKNTKKNWQRIYCNTRGTSITLEFTFSNAQMVGNEQEQDVQIDAQVLWMRKAGRELTVF